MMQREYTHGKAEKVSLLDELIFKLILKRRRNRGKKCSMQRFKNFLMQMVKSWLLSVMQIVIDRVTMINDCRSS